MAWEIDGEKINKDFLKSLLEELSESQKKFYEKVTEIKSHLPNELNRIITEWNQSSINTYNLYNSEEWNTVKYSWISEITYNTLMLLNFCLEWVDNINKVNSVSAFLFYLELFFTENIKNINKYKNWELNIDFYKWIKWKVVLNTQNLNIDILNNFYQNYKKVSEIGFFTINKEDLDVKPEKDIKSEINSRIFLKINEENIWYIEILFSKDDKKSIELQRSEYTILEKTMKLWTFRLNEIYQKWEVSKYKNLKFELNKKDND